MPAEDYKQELWHHDRGYCPKYNIIAGVDEAGRGPLAGSVVAGCAVLNLNNVNIAVYDSKKLSEAKREQLYGEILEKSLYWSVGEASAEEIDNINILQATFLAMRRAVQSLGVKPDLLLVDGNFKIPELYIEQISIIKGDSKSASVAAGSILAKVTRDRQMRQLHRQYPLYGFESNKGYGSASHIKAILEHGFTPHHRRSFKPKALSQTDLFK